MCEYAPTRHPTNISSSRTRSGTLACPGTYSKRPRFRNNLCRTFPKIPDIRCAIPGRQPLRLPGLVPGPIKTTRDIKSTTSLCSKDPEYRGAISERRRVSYKIPDMRYAIPGRQPLRLPGLVPGPIKTTRDIKSTTSRCSKDPEYRGAISGRRGIGYKIPDIRCAIPGRRVRR